MIRFGMLALVAALAVGACGAEERIVLSRYTKVRGPDGTMDWYTIECLKSTARCYAWAGTLCPRGYTVVDRSVGNVETSGTATGQRAWGRTRVSHEAEESARTAMLVHCIAPPAAAPVPAPPVEGPDPIQRTPPF